MARGRLPIWHTVMSGYELAGSAFVGLRGATVIALIAMFAATAWHWPVIEPTGRQTLVTMAVRAAQAAVLSPYAILIHRRIILREDGRSYVGAAASLRAVHFVAVALLLNLILYVGPTAMFFVVISHAGRSALTAVILLGLASLTAAAIFFVRSLLAFPAIATDASRSPIADSFRLTRGSAWRIFLIVFLAGLPIALLEFAAERAAHAGWVRDSGLALHGLVAVLATFNWTLVVAIASHLYKTRDDWPRSAADAASAAPGGSGLSP